MPESAIAWDSPVTQSSISGSVEDRTNQRLPVDRSKILTSAARAFIRLLQVTGLSGGRSWLSLLYATGIYAQQSWFAWYFLQKRFGLLLKVLSYRPFFDALIGTGFGGLPTFLMWAPLSATFFFGRRKYAALLNDLLETLSEVERLPKLSISPRKRSRAGEFLWVIVITLTVGIFATRIHPPSRCRSLTLECATLIGQAFWYGLNFACFALVAMKFIFAGYLIISGFHTVNAELEAIVGDIHLPDTVVVGHLRRITQLHKRLSDCFSRLMSAMTAELVLVMLYGILLEIILMLSLMVLTQLVVTVVVRLVLYAITSLVTLAGQCETCHRALTELARSRDLLMELEWARPELARHLEPLQKAVDRDLATLGDLGLYRLRRSTLTEVWSTILTYIIVLMQFLISERGSAGQVKAT